MHKFKKGDLVRETALTKKKGNFYIVIASGNTYITIVLESDGKKSVAFTDSLELIQVF